MQLNVTFHAFRILLDTNLRAQEILWYTYTTHIIDRSYTWWVSERSKRDTINGNTIEYWRYSFMFKCVFTCAYMYVFFIFDPRIHLCLVPTPFQPSVKKSLVYWCSPVSSKEIELFTALLFFFCECSWTLQTYWSCYGNFNVLFAIVIYPKQYCCSYLKIHSKIV